MKRTIPLIAVIAMGCLARAVPEPGTAARQQPPPPPISVPAGCEQNLSGRYFHAQADTFRYQAIDDGGTLTLELQPGGPQVLLHRTPNGFVGATQATAGQDAGLSCPVELETRLVSCGDAGLVLQTEPSVRFDGACQALPPGGDAGTAEHQLVRARR